MRKYNFNVSFSFKTFNVDGCLRGEHQSAFQIEADNMMEARRIARPMVKRLGGNITRVEKHNAYA